jgi:hypothetical protein
MSKTLQFRRYNTATIAVTTGSAGELIVNTDANTITVHDGVTAGGWQTPTLAYTQAAFATANSSTGYQVGINAAQNTSITSATANTVYLQGALATANANITTAATVIPQNPQSSNYVLQLSDAGKHLYYTQSSNVVLYIPTTSNVAFTNGASIMIVSQTTSKANVTISPNTGVTMYLAGNTTSASRNVTSYGMATLIQVAANTWFINGTGVA